MNIFISEISTASDYAAIVKTEPSREGRFAEWS